MYRFLFNIKWRCLNISDLNETKNAQLVSVIGGLFGGFVFIVILIAMGAIFKNYIKVCFLDFFYISQ